MGNRDDGGAGLYSFPLIKLQNDAESKEVAVVVGLAEDIKLAIAKA